MSRRNAFATLTIEEFEREMSGIFPTSINHNTHDENTMAYKKKEDIVGNITPTAEIVSRIMPIYNFKANEDTTFPKRNK